MQSILITTEKGLVIETGAEYIINLRDDDRIKKVELMENKLSNKDILRKAIEKAVKNGYWHAYYSQSSMDELFDEEDAWYSVIFSPEFAKTFWEECKNPDYGPLCIIHNCDIRDCKTWQYHLQQMVIAKDKYKYLMKFL